MNETHSCLNCGAALEGVFCKDCGQKASTHRLSFLHFLQHDLVHGLFHLDKGVLHTLKELLYRPGATAREYIAGKRVKHYSIFAFYIIVVALRHYLSAKTGSNHEYFESTDKATDAKLNYAIANYYKFIYLLVIPLLSCLSWVFFRRLRYNLTEHIVLNAFLLSGVFLYALLFTLLDTMMPNRWVDWAGIVAIVFYTFLGYYQATKGIYSFLNYLWRAILVNALFTSSSF